MTEQIVSKEEVPLEVLRPVGTNEQIIRAWKDFQSLKVVLLTDDDYYEPSRGKSVIRKSGWRKLAVAFGLTDEILNQTQEWEEVEEGVVNPNNLKDNWTWRIRVKVTSRGGRSVEAVGACSTKERRFAHAEHDSYAMAHTRAKSRAIADMLGAADQVAEEAPEEEPPARKADLKGWTTEELFEAIRKESQQHPDEGPCPIQKRTKEASHD